MGKGSSKGLQTIIGPGAVFEGTISAPHSVRVDGTIKKGKIEIAETLTVGPEGVIEGDVIAKSAIIGGKVTGNVSAEERVELEANASLRGDLRTRDLVINEGATFQGACAMNDKGEVRV